MFIDIFPNVVYFRPSRLNENGPHDACRFRCPTTRGSPTLSVFPGFLPESCPSHQNAPTFSHDEMDSVGHFSLLFIFITSRRFFPGKIPHNQPASISTANCEPGA